MLGRSLPHRMVLLKWAVCAGTLSGMAMAPGLWTGNRGFPTMPAWAWVPELPISLSAVLTFALVASILGVAIHPKPGRFALVPPAIGFFMAIFDMSRVQPWFFEYALVLIGLAWMDWDEPESARSRSAWAVCATVLIAIYFWSGLQKANPIFATQVFPWLLQPLGPALASKLSALWPVAPIVETSVGLLLLWPRTRWIGLGLATTMHVLVLLALGPLGQNYDSIVWPWNFWLIAMGFALFADSKQEVLRSTWRLPVGKAIVILLGLLPVLNFAGLWDGFLSSSFYSGKLRDGWIYLTADGAAHLPPEYVRGNKGLVREGPNRYRLDILLWSMSEMNAPPYGEPRFYPGIVGHLAKGGVPPSAMVLVVQDPVSLTDARRGVTQMPVE
jgi:hypothetical protein